MSTPANSPPCESIAWSDPARRAAFERWLAAIDAPLLDAGTLRPASADASFRRYFRVDSVDGRASCIVMDAPPPQEDVRPFVHVARLIADAGLHAPQVLAADAAQGFLLLTDLGAQPYLTVLQEAIAAGRPEHARALMREALAALVQWQSRVDANSLPPYDEALLRRELALFPEWCVAREYGVTWTPAQHAVWDAACACLLYTSPSPRD